MSAAEILHALADQGCTLATEGDRLTVTPASRLTAALRDEIRAHKPELLALLTQADQRPINSPSTPHRLWLITWPEGQRFSATFTPPRTRAEVLALYPGALVESEREPSEPTTPTTHRTHPR